jgi:hypothetical protein
MSFRIGGQLLEQQLSIFGGAGQETGSGQGSSLRRKLPFEPQHLKDAIIGFGVHLMSG